MPVKKPIKFEIEEMIENIALTFSFSKKARLIRISISKTGRVKVTVPKRASLEGAKKFAQSKISWIQTNLHKINQHKKEQLAKPKLSAHEFLNRNNYLITRCQELAKKYDFEVGKIILRRQKSIWGSCSAANNISLNANLVFVPDELIDYVILHELVHTKVKNHSQKFWRKLEEILPNARILSRKLSNYSAEFSID